MPSGHGRAERGLPLVRPGSEPFFVRGGGQLDVEASEQDALVELLYRFRAYEGGSELYGIVGPQPVLPGKFLGPSEEWSVRGTLPRSGQSSANCSWAPRAPSASSRFPRAALARAAPTSTRLIADVPMARVSSSILSLRHAGNLPQLGGGGHRACDLPRRASLVSGPLVAPCHAAASPLTVPPGASPRAPGGRRVHLSARPGFHNADCYHGRRWPARDRTASRRVP